MRTKKPWPTKEAMEQVYDMKLWGGRDVDFYSGEGSHLAEIVEPYVESVNSFLKSFNEALIVCDLGCGDFNVGMQIFYHSKDYIAIDIVPALIDRNKMKFNEINLTFHCIDIAKDELPKADCVILRQVLQHLSNSEVEAVVSKLGQYKFVILTEHLPEGDFNPNVDIISGQGIRIKKGSGLDITQPPFNFVYKDKKELVSYQLPRGKGIIKTVLYSL